MKRMRAVESDSVKSAKKAKDKFHKAYERASETRERTVHRQNAHASMRANFAYAITKHNAYDRRGLVRRLFSRAKNSLGTRLWQA